MDVVSALDDLWDPWSPEEVTQRLSTVAAPWYVAAGWALELFTAGAARQHHDIEIAISATRFDEVAAALAEFEWNVVGDGQVWPYPEKLAEHFQTWLLNPGSGRYHLDVFREPHLGDLWACRRNPSITLPYNELILHTSAGIPYAIPEVVLLFKAKHRRDKDEADLRRVLPTMAEAQRSRLASWLARTHPGHPWIDVVATRH
jgi:hypothetical protein